MAKNNAKIQIPDGFDSLYQKYVNFITETPKNKRITLLIVGLVLIAVLCTFGSFELLDNEWWIWIQTIVAFPAGIIIFAILVGIQKASNVRNWSISSFKTDNSHIQRIRKISITAVVLAAIFIIFGQYLPYGFGGAIMVSIILTGYNLLRRTPQESMMSAKGIIDSRDIDIHGNVSKGAAMDLRKTVDEPIIDTSTDINNGDVK